MNLGKTNKHTNPNIKTRVLGIGTSNCDVKKNEIEVGKLIKESDGTWSLDNKGVGLRDVY